MRAVPAPFVGREPELRRLTEALAQARGVGRVVLVVGEAGVGKSRLLDEFAARTRHRAIFLIGRGSPASQATPYSVVLEALESHLRKLPAADLRALGGNRLEDLAGLLPSFGAVAPGLAMPGTRLGHLEGLRTLLESLSASRPLVLSLDDLHSADPSSWIALNYLARNPPAGMVLVVGTVRRDELYGRAELASLVATLIKDGLALELPLAPLDIESVAAMVRRALPAAIDAGLPEWLYGRARGNALYTVALLEELDRDPSRRVVPLGVRERVRIQLLGLPAAARQVLELAAVIGRPFGLGLLLRLVPALAATQLDRLLATGLLVETGAGEESTYDFAHPVVQESVYETLGPGRRRELHQAIAAALPRSELSIRAYHIGRSASPSDLVAADVLLEAARADERNGAHREALEHLGRALAIVPADDVARRRMLLDEIAWQASVAADHVSGVEALEQLALLVGPDPVETARTEIRLASFLATGRGELDRAASHARRAVELLSGRDNSRHLAAALNELAWIEGESGDLGAQVERSLRAAELARHVGADEVLMHALGCAGHALALIGDVEGSFRCLDESLTLAQASGEGDQVGWHTAARAVALLMAGRAEEARALLDALLDSRPSASQVAYYSRAHINWHLGRWDAVLADVEAVQALNASAPSVHSAWVLSLGGAVLAGQGHAEGAASLLAQSERAYQGRPFYCFSAWHDWAVGHACWLQGDQPGAAARFERGLERLEAMGAKAAAELVRPDLGQLRGWTVGVGDAALPPLRSAREHERAGRLAEAARIYASLPAPAEERRVVASLRESGPAGRRAAKRAGSLTERERVVAELAAGGLRDHEIAQRLHIGERTVQTHLAHVYAKLGIGGREALRGSLPR